MLTILHISYIELTLIMNYEFLIMNYELKYRRIFAHYFLLNHFIA